MEFEAHIPNAWAEGCARLDKSRAPNGVPLERWRQFIGDAEQFLRTWAAKAAALGWGAEDLFCAHASKPYDRTDYMGLVWVLNGARVVDFTNDVATIEKSTGVRQFYRRGPYLPGTVLAWELGS